MTTPAPVRLPAEWESQSAVHIAWPANAADWPGKFAPIPWVITEIIRHILPVTRVRLLAKYDRHAIEAARCLKRAGLDSERVEIIEFPIDRGWMRDISPAFVAAPDGTGRAVGFRFTGWAKYDNHKLDAKWPTRCARHLGLPLEKAEWRGRQVVLEGGAIDGNGAGTLLTTEECLLDPHTQIRNQGFTREDYEGLFAQYLGIKRVVWLGKGIAGDDTHGHVDDLCRFVNKNTVLLCREKHSGDANYTPLEENRERLQGEKLNVIELPMPAPVVFDRMRLPASYANFLITNGRVIVPTFNDPNDRIALGIIAEAFPGHVAVGVHAVDLVWGLGTVHCLTHEEPEFNR
jgi:agmatine deiminase